MRKFFTITIDVEPDCTPSWKYSDPLQFQGVTHGIKNILQPLFNTYNACPTYLINNVVLEDAASIDTFLNLHGRFELGTHLHAEFIAPEKQFSDYAGKKGETNQCFLGPAIESAKMKNITDLFERNLHRKPTSFRAGRFSAGINTIATLRSLGYKVDSSVTPHVVWNDKSREQPVDYRNAPEQPYWIKSGSYLQSDLSGEILEVPVTIMRKSTLFGSKPVWLRPHISTFKEFKRIFAHFSEKYSGEDHIVFNIMFHNVEVIPGLSPYSKTEKDSRSYLSLLDEFLSYTSKHEIISVGLTDLYDIYKKR